MKDTTNIQAKRQSWDRAVVSRCRRISDRSNLSQSDQVVDKLHSLTPDHESLSITNSHVSAQW